MIRKLGIVLAVIISMYIGVEQCHSQSISSTLSDMIHQAEDGDEAAMWSLAIYSYTGEFAHEGIPKNIIQSISNGSSPCSWSRISIQTASPSAANL